MLAQSLSTVQTDDDMYIVHRVYNFGQLGPSPFCQANNLHAKYICRKMDASLRGAIKRSGEECQTHHCQHKITNIGDKF